MPILAVVTTVAIAPWDLAPAWLAPLPDSIQEQLEDAVDAGIDGIVVYVDQAGHPPQFFAAGLKNKASGTPADPQALFKIGSIHKLYVAAAVTKLAARGLISTDDTIADRLPALAARLPNADRITLRMMVQHRSGIANFTDDSAFDWFTPIGEEAIMDLILGSEADFEPDSRFSYSNSNYFLLGRVMDEVLGYSHHQFVYEEILGPMGLSNTWFSFEEVDPEDVTSGYWYGYEEDLRDLGGSMIATVMTR